MSPSEATGVFQSDLLLRHALLQGIRELRANVWLLDYICAGMQQDILTKDLYGDKDVQNLKNWFLKTEIPVITYGRLGDPVCPSVSINLVSSTEDRNTLGDVHYKPSEDVPNAPWPDLTPQFTPLFSLSTGLVTLPMSVVVDVYPGMQLMDAQGAPHEILTVETDRTFTIAVGKPFDFSRATLRAGSPSTVQTLESSIFRESYLMGVHVSGEPFQLIFLHSIIVFLLLWGREELLEGRGFETSHITSSDFAKNQEYGIENVWSRYITVDGVIRTCWPKRRFQKLTGVSTRIRVSDSDTLPSDSQPVKDALWIGDKDTLG